jgi:chemotaxis signal transduction protein
VSDSGYSAKALRMKEEFDRTFSLPMQADPPQTVDLLAIRLRGDGFALRAREISGLTMSRKIVPLPGAAPALLGLTGIRGTLMPAWDLASLLGYGGQSRSARWLVLGQGEAPWALAFDGFDGFFRVPGSDIHPGAVGDAGTASARESCVFGGCGRPVVSLPAILETIRKFTDSSQARRW